MNETQPLVESPSGQRADRTGAERVKVLLVDDLDKNLMALESLLRCEDVELLKARSGRQALELLLHHEVALALIDVRMPEMDGIELAELMRGHERTRRIPIMLVTAEHHDEQPLFRGYEAGAVDFLYKPIEPRILRGKVGFFLELHRQKQRLTRLQELTASFARLLSPQQVADVGLPACLRAVGASQAALMTLDNCEAGLRVIGTAGVAHTPLAGAALAEPSTASEAVLHQCAIFVESLEAWQLGYGRSWGSSTDAGGTRAALPLVIDGHTMGALSLTFPVWRPLSPGERTLLRAIADQFAQALERARLFEAERQARQELSHERDFIGRLLDTLGALVVVLDQDGRIVRWNPICESITGYTFEEVRARPLWDSLLDSDQKVPTQRMLTELATGASVVPFEGTWLTKSSTRRWIAWSHTAMRDALGQLQYVIATGIDVTDKKAREYERERLHREAQQALRVREDCIAMASHDVRSPLSAVALLLTVMRMRATTNENIDPSWFLEQINRAHRNIDQAVELMDGLLEQARSGSDELELQITETDLVEVVREHLARSREQLERAGCPVTLHGQGPVVGRWDALRIDQALGNLLSNAMKYGRGKPIDVHVLSKETSAQLRLVDRGIGISSDDQAKIFEKFRRASAEGRIGSYGLGLWIVKQIVTALGGTITVQSVPNAGTTFTVDLPYAGPKPLPAE